jgi:double zinc ribbon protein
MSVLQCLACQHESPATAKFCSECGGQLNLKLCKQCEAINERAWQRCYNCGAEFAAQPIASHLRAAEPAPLDVRVAHPPFSSLVPVTRKPSAAHSMRRSRTLVCALAFATMAGLAFYLYRQPNLNPNVMHSVRSTPGQPSVGSLPAASVTRVDAGAAAADLSPAKTKAAVVPVRARSFNKKQSAAVTAGDSAVKSPQELAATIASDVPQPNVKNPPAGTAAAAGDTVRAKPTKPLAAEPTVGGSAHPVSPNDFQFIAPPP